MAGGSHSSQAPTIPAVSAGDQAPQQRLGGPDDQLAVVGDDHVVAALDVLAGGVAEVVADQRGREAGTDHDQVPLAAQRVVGGQVGAAYPRPPG
jgi:hypothetical protein